jgi:hypothetical protein
LPDFVAKRRFDSQGGLAALEADPAEAKGR